MGRALRDPQGTSPSWRRKTLWPRSLELGRTEAGTGSAQNPLPTSFHGQVAQGLELSLSLVALEPMTTTTSIPLEEPPARTLTWKPQGAPQGPRRKQQLQQQQHGRPPGSPALRAHGWECLCLLLWLCSRLHPGCRGPASSRPQPSPRQLEGPSPYTGPEGLELALREPGRPSLAAAAAILASLAEGGEGGKLQGRFLENLSGC